jgi:hypothetical protein
LSLQRDARKLREARKLLALIVSPELREDAVRLTSAIQAVEEKAAALLSRQVDARRGP